MTGFEMVQMAVRCLVVLSIVATAVVVVCLAHAGDEP